MWYAFVYGLCAAATAIAVRGAIDGTRLWYWLDTVNAVLLVYWFIRISIWIKQGEGS